jgi:hypothetical protein
MKLHENKKKKLHEGKLRSQPWLVSRADTVSLF